MEIKVTCITPTKNNIPNIAAKVEIFDDDRDSFIRKAEIITYLNKATIEKLTFNEIENAVRDAALCFLQDVLAAHTTPDPLQ